MADSNSGCGGLLVTAIVGPIIVGLAIWLFTASNSPFHHTKPSTTGGTIEAVALDNGTPCCTFDVKASIQGYDGQTCTSQAVVINSDTGEQSSPIDEDTYTPEAGQDEGVAHDGVKIDKPGNYIVRFILYAPNGTEMDQKDSSQLSVS
jgi:hypothetical protein